MKSNERYEKKLDYLTSNFENCLLKTELNSKQQNKIK